MSLNTNAIISVADLQAYLGKAPGDVAQDAFLETVINTVSGSIEGFLNSVVKKRAFSGIIHDGGGKRYIYPVHRPILKIGAGDFADPALVTDIQWRPSPAQAWENLEGDMAYVLIRRANPYMIYLDRMFFPEGVSNIKLNYWAGMDPIPSDITSVATEASAMMWKESFQGEGTIGVGSTSKSTGGVNTSKSYTGLTERHLAILRRYRSVIM